MDLRIFEDYPGISAGFTRKPDLSTERRDRMVSTAARLGQSKKRRETPADVTAKFPCVIRPVLVHGKRIVNIDNAFLEKAALNEPGSGVSMPLAGLPYIEIEDTDGIITKLQEVTLTSTHGDCIPVWACDGPNGVVGLAHAGWKGTLLEIAAELVKAMESCYGCSPGNIEAFIGPGIDKCHFEVDVDVAEKFMKELPWSAEFISEDPRSDRNAPVKYHIDLKGINRRSLENAGVKYITVSEDCTFCREDLYYSYRRGKDMDRMLAYIKTFDDYQPFPHR